MSKIKELVQRIDELEQFAEAALDTVQFLRESFGGKTEIPKLQKKAITLEEVRAVLADKSRAGFTAEVKALIESHGAGRLSDIDPTAYEVLLAEAEVIGNAG